MKEIAKIASILAGRYQRTSTEHPGEAAAHGPRTAQIALFTRPVGDRHRQRQRDRCRRRIAVQVDREKHHLLRRNMQLVRRSIDDSLVGLVRDEPVDVVGIGAGGVESVTK